MGFFDLILQDVVEDVRTVFEQLDDASIYIPDLRGFTLTIRQR